MVGQLDGGLRRLERRGLAFDLALSGSVGGGGVGLRLAAHHRGVHRLDVGQPEDPGSARAGVFVLVCV